MFELNHVDTEARDDDQVRLEVTVRLVIMELGIREDVTSAQTAAWIRSQQLADGSWNIYYGGPPNLSATVESYVGLRVACDPAEAEHMKRAAEQIRAMGGVERTRVFTRIWLSLVGLWSWDDIPALPPELIFLPSWFPLNIYDFGCWARQTIVPLTIVAAPRPVRPLPVDVDELRVGAVASNCSTGS